MGKPKPPPVAGLTDEQRDKAIADEYAKEVLLSEIQDKYNVSPGYIYRILEKYGIKPRRNKTPTVKLQSPNQPLRSDPIAQAVRDVMTKQPVGVPSARPRPSVPAVADAAPVAETIPVGPLNPLPAPKRSQAYVDGKPVPPPDVMPAVNAGYEYDVTVQYSTMATLTYTADDILEALIVSKKIPADAVDVATLAEAVIRLADPQPEYRVVFDAVSTDVVKVMASTIVDAARQASRLHDGEVEVLNIARNG